MSVSTGRTQPGPAPQIVRRPGRWIDDWRPEDPHFWAGPGRRVARTNLVLSIFTEHLGFSVWLLWSIVVVQLGRTGWDLTVSQTLWLTAIPSGVGALLRLPYTFAVPLFGGRNWTVVSAALLVVPCLGLAWGVNHPEIGWVGLAVIAGTAGVGGGNFASSMANISYFYPEAHKGWALGMNAAGGNVGVAIAQFLVPKLVVLGGGVSLAWAGLFYLPLAVIAAVLALLFMDNISEARADATPVWLSLKDRHTWVLSLLYIGTFGSFIGYSAAFPTLLKAVFHRPDIALTYAFLGAGVGSLARPVGGLLSDRLGGARVTVASFALLSGASAAALVSVRTENLTLFFVAFMVLFVGTGIGNGSTYRMIPWIFRLRAEEAGGDRDSLVHMRHVAAGALGIISAVGAFGGFAVPIAYAWSSARFGSIEPALRLYVAFFVVLMGLTWAVYRRGGSRIAGAGI